MGYSWWHLVGLCVVSKPKFLYAKHLLKPFQALVCLPGQNPSMYFLTVFSFYSLMKYLPFGGICVWVSCPHFWAEEVKFVSFLLVSICCIKYGE